LLREYDNTILSVALFAGPGAKQVFYLCAAVGLAVFSAELCLFSRGDAALYYKSTGHEIEEEHRDYQQSFYCY
jgi:hypothetical protein